MARTKPAGIDEGRFAVLARVNDVAELESPDARLVLTLSAKMKAVIIVSVALG